MTDEALQAAADDLSTHLNGWDPTSTSFAACSPAARRLIKETEMLIHPWDAALDTSEWQDWLASTDRFGMLAVNNLDLAQAPLVLPIHFTLAGDDLLITAPRGDRRLADPPQPDMTTTRASRTVLAPPWGLARRHVIRTLEFSQSPAEPSSLTGWHPGSR